MRKKLGKRGSSFFESIYFIMFQVFLVTGVGLLLMGYVISKVDNTSFEKQYYSRDIALLINAIYASPGNVVYTYDVLPKDYSANIIHKGVIINDTFNKEKAIPIGFPHIVDSNLETEGFDTKFKNEPIVFVKKENKLNIGTDPLPQLELTQCQKILQQNIKTELGDVAIIPSYHEDYGGEIKQREKDITAKIAKSFDQDNYVITKIGDSSERIRERVQNSDTALILSLSSDSDPKELPDNEVNIYYGFDDGNTTMKLACLMLKYFSETEGVETGNIIKMEDDIFQYAWVTLKIDAGNLDSAYDFDNEHWRISYAIRSALKEYEK